MATNGVWELSKVAANDFALGAKVYWNGTTKLATSTTSGATLIGVAVAAAGASTATLRVRMSGF